MKRVKSIEDTIFIIMKIYTKTGDSGKTSLINGRKVFKADPLIESYGTIDELNAALGIAIEEMKCHSDQKSFNNLIESLQIIQNQLFTIGGMLATDFEDREKYWGNPPIMSWMQAIESEIDVLQVELPPFKNFILPRGSRIAAYLHLARTVCRRAERNICRLICPDANNFLSSETNQNGTLIQYINRLSDFLFIMTRKVLQLENIDEIYWKSTR